MKLLLSFCLLIITIFAFGQEEYGQNKYYVPSPQTSDFMKYGNVPVSNYTGHLNLQIPIYNYSDNDFNIDVSIGYNSSGFVANKQPGIVGMNWFLNAGGAITRTTKGVPDDKVGHPESGNDPPFVHGLWYGLKRDANTYTSSNIFNFNAGLETIHLEWALGSSPSASDDYETTSDIYNFNFMGYAGKFIIGQDKQAHVFGIEGANTFDIDLTGYSDQYDGNNYPNSSTIKIKTGDGYKYTFGGSIEKLEYTAPVNVDFEPGVYFNPTIVSWHLSEIEAPNDRIVNFEYRPFIGILPVTRDTFNYILNIYPKSYSSYYDAYNSYGWMVSHSLETSYSSEDPNYELLKTVYLKKIKIDNDCEINFSYSEKAKELYQTITTEYPHLYEQKNLKLDSIVVKSYDNIVKKANLGYVYYGSSNKERLFLNEIEIIGQKPYSFSYVSGNYPSPLTRGLDYWGFWSGVDNQWADLVPSVSLDALGNLSYTSNERTPSTSNGVFNLGLLYKVTYPTGGYTLIEYEPHRYTQKLDRRSDNNFLPKLYSSTETNAGGARIKKLTDYDGVTQYNEREFIYKKDYNPSNPGSGTSSGILLNWPRFIYAFHSDLFPGHGDVNVVQVNSLGISVNATDNEYITYSHIVEKRSDNSFTEFQYSNYSTNPDDLVQSSFNSSIYGHTVDPRPFYIGIYRQPNCKSYERGKLKKKSNHSSGGDLVSEEIYDYDRWGDENYIASILLSGDKFFSRKDYTYPYVLKYDTVRNYSLTAQGVYGNDFVQTVTEYDYSSLNLLSMKKMQNSDNHWNIKKYYYPDDYNNVENFQILINKNIKNKVVDTRKYNNSQLISGTQTKYNNFGQPIETYNFESTANDIAFNATTPFTFTQKQTISYNVDKNPEKLDIVDNLKTYYLWAYNKQYPIAKIESNSVLAISNLQSAINVLDLSGSNVKTQIDTDILNIKNAISTDVILANMVTIYTYKPLVGMTSQTDPAGRTTYYEYDDFGRLKLVRDQNGNIVSKNEYHYAGQ